VRRERARPVGGGGGCRHRGSSTTPP
jgi:hypothetical protein